MSEKKSVVNLGDKDYRYAGNLYEDAMEMYHHLVRQDLVRHGFMVIKGMNNEDTALYLTIRLVARTVAWSVIAELEELKGNVAETTLVESVRKMLSKVAYD